jgi:hypothetical protein
LPIVAVAAEREEKAAWLMAAVVVESVWDVRRNVEIVEAWNAGCLVPPVTVHTFEAVAAIVIKP